MNASVIIVPVNHPDVLLLPIHSPATLGSPENERLGRYSVILESTVEQPILGLTVQWIVRNSAGTNTIKTIRSDSYLYSTAPVVDAHGRLLITPFGFQALPQEYTSLTSGAAPGNSLLGQLDSSPEVLIVCD